MWAWKFQYLGFMYCLVSPVESVNIFELYLFIYLLIYLFFRKAEIIVSAFPGYMISLRKKIK